MQVYWHTQVYCWWEANRSKLIANLSKIGSRHKQVLPASFSPAGGCIGKQPLIAQHWPVWWHVFTAQVKSITWKLEAVPGPRILIYTITIKLTDMARAPITFTCSPQVSVDPFTRSNQNFKATKIFSCNPQDLHDLLTTLKSALHRFLWSLLPHFLYWLHFLFVFSYFNNSLWFFNKRAVRALTELGNSIFPVRNRSLCWIHFLENWNNLPFKFQH